MSFENYDQALDRAADLCGVEPRFWDIFGHLHTASVQTKRAIVEALGMPAATKEDLESAIAQREKAELTRILPPCLVVDLGELLRIPVQLPETHSNVLAAFEIALEDGSRLRFEKIIGARMQVELDARLPLGYHELSVSVAGLNPESISLIVAPERAFLPESLAHGKKAAGVAVSLYGLRSELNWGCGDFRDLRDAIDWVAEIGADFVALNPLHAIHNRRPYNTSPYLPNSVFYQNLIYLEVPAIEEFEHSTEARRVWFSPETQEEARQLRESEFVEYERVNALKLRFLRLLFAEFRRAGRPLEKRNDFEDYRRREGDLLYRFATYCALDEHLHAADPDVWIWPDWPAGYQDPDSPKTREFQRKHAEAILFHQYVQWQIDIQLNAAQQYARAKGLSIGLYHDLALATDRCGSDLWAHRPFYVAGCRVGSPPDDFSPAGQDWAFPPPNAERHRATGYRLFRESIRKSCRHGGALRIDHVMRFFRLYWIPDGSDATAGAYVRDRSEDLVRILALESFRNRVAVVGEDLGTVEPHIRETLARFGILSYRLFYFERGPHGSFKRPDEYPHQSLVSSTTHDLPTLAGFWIHEDIEARRRAGVVDDAEYRRQIANRLQDKQKMLDALFDRHLLPSYFPRTAIHVPELTGELHNAVIGFLASTPSMLMVVNQEDLTKETHQQNLPGTTSQYPNWSRKMRFTFEQLRTEPLAMGSMQMFRDWMRRTGRESERIAAKMI